MGLQRRDSWSSRPCPTTWPRASCRAGRPPQGFGSSRVRVGIGATRWSSSAFPDRTRGYLLPVRRAVRGAEGLRPGDVATVSPELLEL
nr:DUF1905 domain-containing protein [Saccharomonospora marina]